jgi:hypothetical protein
VQSDYAFKKYLQHCSASDLLLLRGLLIKVCCSSSSNLHLNLTNSTEL